MKFLFSFIIGYVCSFCLGQAQTAVPQKNLVLTYNNGLCDLDWETESGRTYFIQYSFDMEQWNYLEFLVEGDGTDENHWFYSSGADEIFLRLKYTDASTNGNPNGADFDNDGYSNFNEIQHGTDPFVFTSGPANPGPGGGGPGGGGNPPNYPDYPPPPTLAPHVVYRLNVDTVGTGANPSPPERVQYHLDEEFRLLALNGNPTDPLQGDSHDWPVSLPAGKVEVKLQLVALAGEPYERKLSLLESEYTFTNGLQYSAVELTVPPNLTDSNIETFGELVDTVADRALGAVVMKFNETMAPLDDLIAVSAGTDDDLATDFSVTALGLSGITADLSIGNANGSAIFKDGTLTLADGVENKTKVWGSAPSSAQGQTEIEVQLKENGNDLEAFTAGATVFKGVEIQFDGKCYSNLDVREFGRRPWDGRSDPKPNSKYDPIIKQNPPGYVALGPYILGMNGLEVIASIHSSSAFDFYTSNSLGHQSLLPSITRYSAAVDADLTFGYGSDFSFNANDNPAISSYRPWTVRAEIEVTVVKVFSVDPDFEIEEDPLLGLPVKLKSGSFSNVGNLDDFYPDATEVFRSPTMEIEGELVISSSGKLTDTRITLGHTLLPAKRFSDLSKPKFDFVKADFDGRLDAYISSAGNPQKLRDLAMILKARAAHAPTSNMASWENDDMTYNLVVGNKSLLARHIVDQVKRNVSTYRNRATWAGVDESSGMSLLIDGKVIENP